MKVRASTSLQKLSRRKRRQFYGTPPGLDSAAQHLQTGKEQLEMHIAGEILAEELRLTQQYLNEITGEFMQMTC